MADKLPISASPGPKRPQNDPAYDEMRQNKERVKAERRAALAAETESLLSELRSVGIDIAYIGDLRKDTVNFEHGIPLLLEHLGKDYSISTKTVLAHLLATSKATIGWSMIMEEYRRTTIVSESSSLKDMLASALAETVTSATEYELLDAARDRLNGTSRILLLRGLRRSKNDKIKLSLAELASDPELKKEISSWK